MDAPLPQTRKTAHPIAFFTLAYAPLEPDPFWARFGASGSSYVPRRSNRLEGSSESSPDPFSDAPQVTKIARRASGARSGQHFSPRAPNSCFGAQNSFPRGPFWAIPDRHLAQKSEPKSPRRIRGAVGARILALPEAPRASPRKRRAFPRQTPAPVSALPRFLKRPAPKQFFGGTKIFYEKGGPRLVFPDPRASFPGRRARSAPPRFEPDFSPFSDPNRKRESRIRASETVFVASPKNFEPASQNHARFSPRFPPTRIAQPKIWGAIPPKIFVVIAETRVAFDPTSVCKQTRIRLPSPSPHSLSLVPVDSASDSQNYGDFNLPHPSPRPQIAPRFLPLCHPNRKHFRFDSISNHASFRCFRGPKRLTRQGVS